MRYEVITDGDGYVQVIRHTGTVRDYVELDLNQYNLEDNRMYAYKLGKDELIFDADKYDEIYAETTHKANLKEIAKLEKELADTDYICTKWADEAMKLTNPLTFQSDVATLNAKYQQEYGDILKQREIWRTEIRELEDSYE